MTILASKIVSDAAIVLQDITFQRWTQAELLGWLNVVRRAAASIRPDMFIATTAVKLAAGARQALPAQGHRLIRLNSNMGTSGTTPGKSILAASRDHLDAQNRNWRTAGALDDVDCYSYDAGSPLEFWVSPPNTGNGYVEMTYAVIPADIALTDPIGCADIFQAPLLDGVLARAFAKDSDQGGSAALATAYYQSFTAGLKGA